MAPPGPSPPGPSPPAARPDLPGRATAALRNGWRQLTSMRTALVLLFLLALAAIPGSLLPQRDVNIDDVNAYFRENPRLAPVLDRLGGFDVYASPWFSAIYLLLFTSLVGCVVPRLRDHLRALRADPVDAPRRLSRLPQHTSGLAHHGDPASTAAAVHRALRARRWRSVVREHDGGSWTVSAEKGYLKETGNLVMHFALVAVLIGVALGAWYGWHGNRLVVAGPENRFCDTLQQYDEYGLGARVDGGSLPPFCFELTEFQAEFTEDGRPTEFLARGEVTEGGGAGSSLRPVEFTVNSPLRLDGANLYLLGHGYAPVLRFTDRDGQVTTTTEPFLPIDSLGTAEGVATFPDADVGPAEEQIAFEGLYLPTAPQDAMMLARSVHPQERSPVLMLLAYRGDLGIDDGTPVPVGTLSQAQLDSGALEQVGDAEFLRPGEAMTLDDGTTVELLGTERWITVSVRHDPGEPIVLAGAALLLAGLVGSLLGRRRRVWFRVTPGTAALDAPADLPATSLVEAGGLPRTGHPGFATEFADLVAALPLTSPELERAGRST